MESRVNNNTPLWVRKTSERRVERITMGFPERLDTISNWTEFCAYTLLLRSRVMKADRSHDSNSYIFSKVNL